MTVQAIAERGALFGRERELAALCDALAEVEQGSGRLLVMVGEPGIGKSRLAEVFAQLAAARGAAIAWGRAWEAGGAPAYWPWIEVLRDLLRGPIDPSLPGLADLAQILPELRERLPELPVPPPLEPAQALFRLFDAVSSQLGRAARDAPLVIILDDLHAADVPTLSLLHFVARGLRRARVLLVGCYREVEARMTAEVAGALTRVAREGRYLALARLDRQDVASWVQSTGAADPELGTLLYQRTEGNPLFLVELLRLLDETRRTGASPAAMNTAIPLGVRDVMRERLDRLPGDARALLALAAVLGRHADVDLLARAAETSPARVRERLAGARAADLLVDTGPSVLSFSHVLVRDVVYDEIAHVRRAQLHLSAAEQILARREASPDLPLAELVHHLFAAAPVAGVDRAIEWARRAAHQARSRLAFEDAVGLLDRALSALPPGREADEFELMLDHAGALFGAGHVDRGREVCKRALALARRLDDPERVARATLAYGDVFVFAQVDPLLIRMLEEGLAALPDADSPLRARLLGRLAAAMQPAPDPEVPMAIAREAIALARRVADPPTCLTVLHAGTSALLYFGEPSERVPLNQELLALAGKLGDKVRVLRGHMRLAVDYLEIGDPARADTHIEALDSLARELGLPSCRWQAMMVRAMRRVMAGRFAEAETLAEEARELADRIEDPERIASFTFFRIGLLRAAARHDELAAFMADAGVIVRLVDEMYARSCLAGAHARLGRCAEARAALGSLLDDTGWTAGRLQVVWLAEVAAVCGDAALAAAIEPMLAGLGGRNHSWGLGAMVCEGPVARARGLVAAELGRFDEAAAHFDDALAGADALGAPPHRARIELEYAGALLRRGRAPDRERARRLLDSAVSAADALGMPGLRDAAGALAADLAPALPATPARAPALPETPAFDLTCEGDYWSIACEGTVFRLRDSRGLRILARLVGAPEREFHVTDLLAPPGEPGLVEDAGEAIDRQAIADYRERIESLRGELTQAEEWNDQGRAGRARAEIEFLGEELARSVGRGGRARRSASTSEKARINVRRRLLDTIEKIAEHSPALGQHLSWALKTGNFCVYHAGGPRPARRGTT